MANLTSPLVAMALQDYLVENREDFENFLDDKHPECAKSQVEWSKDPKNRRLVMRITRVSVSDYKPLTERVFLISLKRQ